MQQPLLGHAAQPWTTFDILSDLERAIGNAAAATEARARALDAFLAYRRDGGENHSGGGRLAALVTHALDSGDTADAESTLAAAADLPEWLSAFLPPLTAILHGDRNPALAEAPALTYDCAAELRLLLDHLAASSPAP